MFLRLRSPLPDRLGLRHWLKVLFIFIIIVLLTWFGKFHRGKQTPARMHGTLAWVVPTPRGLSTLLVLSDDGIDSNHVRTGLRIWLNPPKNPLDLEEKNHALYRGKAMVVIGDSLAPETVQQLGAMVDTGGFLLVLGRQAWTENQQQHLVRHIRFRQSNPHREPWGWLGDLAGEGFKAELRFGFAPVPHLQALDHRLTIAWPGYRIRIWGSMEAALSDTSNDSLSLGILAACPAPGQAIPRFADPALKALFYCGQQTSLTNDTRIALLDSNSGGVFYEDLAQNRLLVKHVHLDWNPATE